MFTEVPDNYKNIGVIMSNGDRTIQNNAEIKLKKGSVYGEYTAWNFLGLVWWSGNEFMCQIMQNHKHINTICGNSLENIMEKACELYGNK